MKYVVAVSGGVDSVVLLDMFVRKYGADSVVVAHFDHGIRSTSHTDAEFVRDVAARYGCWFEGAREELGVRASEAVARTYRYRFLYRSARRHNAQLVTAHHLDDLVETVALHIQRGTGWRGLAPFGRAILRPLLGLTKEDLLEYATHHTLEWREDETNASTEYARNRIRPAVAALSLDVKLQVYALYARQWEIRRAIEREVAQYGDPVFHSRHFFIMTSDAVALEVLRTIVDGRLTRPQLRRLLHATRVAKPSTVYQAGGGVEIHFTTRTFTVELLK